MTFKSILLGSAAVMAVTGAQAADLSVAEPVDYVRVCDAFGAGYWYIPGSDTCIKLGGFARFQANFMTSAVVNPAPAVAHAAAWAFSTSMEQTVTAQSMTQYGALVGHAVIAGAWNNSGTSGTVTLGDIYLSLGNVTAGAISSVYEYGGWISNVLGANIDGLGRTDVVQLHWAMNGFGIALEIGDPRDNFSAILPYTLPTLAGSVTFAQGNWDAEVSGGYYVSGAANAWGVQGGVTFALDSIAAGDQLRLKGQIGSSTGVANAWVAGLAAGATQWAVEGSFLHNLGNGLAFAVGAATTSAGGWNGSGDVIWSAVPGLTVAGSVNITSASVITAAIRATRAW